MTTRRALALTVVLLAALTASGATLTIAPASLQPPQTIPINQAYSVGLTASLNNVPPAAPCSWTISSGTLPTGLKIAPVAGNNGAATISGTPTQAGKSTFTATCIAGPDQGSRQYNLFVTSGLPSITQTSIPQGIQNTAYSSLLTAVGGVPPYTWSFTGNSNGLQLCPQDGALGCPTVNPQGGLIFGTPLAAGTFTLNPVVTDAALQTATVPLTLVVGATVIIQTSSLAPGAVGVTYSQTLVGVGGKAPLVWAVSAGSLPAGLTLASDTGIISGTPTAGGSFPITITLTDASPVTATASFTMNVLGITTTSLPDGAVGTAYSQTLQVVGGVPPITWAVSSGTLPAGLTLNSSTGTISGTPTFSGSSTFTVSAGYTPASVVSVPPPVITQQQLTINVAGLLNITSSPLTFTEGTVVSQSLGSVAGGVGPYTWAVVTGTLPVGLRLDPATCVPSINTTNNTTTCMLLGTTTAPVGTTSITFSVTDSTPAKPLVSRATVSITVNAPPPPTSAMISGLPSSSGPLQQQLAIVSISNAYPLAINNGKLTLAFASSVGGDDQMVRFSSGTCVVNGSSHTCTTPFAIPAGSTQASFSTGANVAVITGTVAGTITVTAQFIDAAGNDVTPSPAPTSTMVVNATVPGTPAVKITSPSPGTLNVTVTGFSSTRDMVSGLFHFAAATGTTLTSADITVQLGSAFAAWYSNTASNVFGSQFTMTIPFTYQANAIPITAVTVTLTNSKGASNASAPASP
jgi:hypothetical protein